MKSLGTRAYDAVDRHPVACLAAGILAVAGRNWHLWQADKATIERVRNECTILPALTRTPKVSILVAAWNEENRIKAHIDSFLALAYPDCELILCAGGADHTLEWARQYAGERIHILEQAPGEGKQRALARCLERATGEIIYLTDADCVLNDDAMLRLLAPIVDEGETATTGGSRPLDEQFARSLPFYIWARDVVSSAHTAMYTQGLLGRNSCVARTAIDGIGGLNFPAPTGTDYHLARRLINAGIGIRHIGSSVIATDYPQSLGMYQRKQSRWLRNLVIYGRQYESRSDVQRTLETMATGAIMLLLPALSPVTGRLPLAVWLVLLSQAVCAKVRYLGMASTLGGRKIPRRMWLSLVPLTLIDFAIWISPGIDVLSREGRARW